MPVHRQSYRTSKHYHILLYRCFVLPVDFERYSVSNFTFHGFLRVKSDLSFQSVFSLRWLSHFLRLFQPLLSRLDLQEAFAKYLWLGSCMRSNPCLEIKVMSFQAPLFSTEQLECAGRTLIITSMRIPFAFSFTLLFLLCPFSHKNLTLLLWSHARLFYQSWLAV